VMGQRLSEDWGQPVVIENRPGGDTVIAAQQVAKAEPDGYTLLAAMDTTLVMNLATKKNLPYDPHKDFAYITMASQNTSLLSVRAEDGPKTVGELIERAKANPGKLNYGRVGTGSVTEVVPRQFEKISGISMTGVTFRGTGPALQEVVANRLEFMVGPISLTMPLLEGKQLKVLAMTSPERLATAPSVPTMKEQGVPIVSEGWWGVCAASDTPAPVLEAINKQVVAAVNSPDFKTPIEKTGVIAGSTSLADAATIWKETANEAEKLYKKIGFERVD
jgi:tripartite-type tricarboxylate transporter receptor subunit TctC